MVGSVLLARMREEGDFARLAEAHFFSTSQAGQPGPDTGDGRAPAPLLDAADLDALAGMDAIVTCQGGDFTAATHAPLRARGWRGYWIDAASTLRLSPSATIVLDPVNRAIIERDLAAGGRDFDSAASILDIDQAVTGVLRAPNLPVKATGGHPLAGSLQPWIDLDLGDGVSREEWKGAAEANKILGRDGDPSRHPRSLLSGGGDGAGDSNSDRAPIPIESVCVRVGVLRCHSQAFTVKLKRDLPLFEVAGLIDAANEWVTVVDNNREESLARLTPTAVTATLDIPVGRLRKLAFGDGGDGGGCHIAAFTVGDQLLWGAAEPLRRMLQILREH